jgi:phthiodiolone/phenolphthiodiolone dimycocerosates ketoreductase
MEAACSAILTLRTPDDRQRLARADGVSPALGLANRARMYLYVAAHGPRMIDVAARFGDGWLPAGFPPRAYGRRLTALRERAEAHGRDPSEIKPLLFVWAALAETRAESDAMLEAPLIRAVALYRSEASFTRHGASHPLSRHGHRHYMPGRLSPDEALALYADVPPAVLRDSVLTGSLEEIQEQLGQYEAAGCEHCIIYDIGRFLDPEGIDRSRVLLQRIAHGRAGALA